MKAESCSSIRNIRLLEFFHIASCHFDLLMHPSKVIWKTSKKGRCQSASNQAKSKSLHPFSSSHVSFTMSIIMTYLFNEAELTKLRIVRMLLTNYDWILFRHSYKPIKDFYDVSDYDLFIHQEGQCKKAEKVRWKSFHLLITRPLKVFAPLAIIVYILELHPSELWAFGQSF